MDLDNFTSIKTIRKNPSYRNKSAKAKSTFSGSFNKKTDRTRPYKKGKQFGKQFGKGKASSRGKGKQYK